MNGPKSVQFFNRRTLNDILVGIEKTTEAFGLLTNSPATPTLFRNVMTPPEGITPPDQYYDYFRIVRVAAPDNCEVTGNTLVEIRCGYMQNNSSTWTPYGYLKPESIVHEFGHVFDIRSGSILRDEVGGGLSGSILDCENFHVMGPKKEDGYAWRRGENGWGSSAPHPTEEDTQTYSRFQQNPIDQGDHIETAGDMFLNWVYRITSPGATTFADEAAACADDSQSLPWEGYQNIDRTGNGLATRQPGDERYRWMNKLMETLSTNNLGWAEGWKTN
jgi:hypothetical protein